MFQGKEGRDDERQKTMIRVPRAEEIEETAPEAPKETAQQRGYESEGKDEGERKTNYPCSATEVVMKEKMKGSGRKLPVSATEEIVKLHSRHPWRPRSGAGTRIKEKMKGSGRQLPVFRDRGSREAAPEAPEP